MEPPPGWNVRITLQQRELATKKFRENRHIVPGIFPIQRPLREASQCLQAPWLASAVETSPLERLNSGCSVAKRANISGLLSDSKILRAYHLSGVGRPKRRSDGSIGQFRYDKIRRQTFMDCVLLDITWESEHREIRRDINERNPWNQVGLDLDDLLLRDECNPWTRDPLDFSSPLMKEVLEAEEILSH